MCSIGLDVPFSSGLLRPLCDVVSPPSAESEPLCLVGYVTEVLALPCLDKKSGRATASSASSPSSPCGTGAGGMWAVVFSAFCAWAPVAWAVGVGTSADLMSAVLAFAGRFFVGQQRLHRESTFPVCRDRGAYLVVPPVTTMAHPSLLEGTSRAGG